MTFEDISTAIDQVRENLTKIDAFFVFSEDEPKLLTEEDVKVNLEKVNEIQDEVNNMLRPKVEALKPSNNDSESLQHYSDILKTLSNLDVLIDEKRVQLNGAKETADYCAEHDDVMYAITIIQLLFILN